MYERAGELRALLNAWDFIGVFDAETNVDEYDCMLSPLLERLAFGADAEEIRAYLDGELRGHFGVQPEFAGTPHMAQRLVAWWNAPNGNHPAIVAFLSAGLSPLPPRSVMVSALADARRAVKAYRARKASVDAWLAGETRVGGIRENAAVLAALESLEWRAEVAAAYRAEHPGRAAALEAVVRSLSHRPAGDAAAS